MTTAAIYARVSGARQKEEQTIGSQVVECKTAAGSWGLDVPEGWVFTDEGYSGAILVRPALERLATWPPRCRWTWWSATHLTAWPASSPTKRC